MISLTDFQPLSIAKINIFQQQPRFYSQICIVSIRKAREDFLIQKGRTIDPNGLNIREETY